MIYRNRICWNSNFSITQMHLKKLHVIISISTIFSQIPPGVDTILISSCPCITLQAAPDGAATKHGCDHILVQYWHTDLRNDEIMCLILQCHQTSLSHDHLFPKYSQKTLHISPMRAKYGVSFVSWKSDLYPALCIVTLYWRLSVRLQYLQCISSGDTAVLHLAIDMWFHVIANHAITLFHCIVILHVLLLQFYLLQELWPNSGTLWHIYSFIIIVVSVTLS